MDFWHTLVVLVVFVGSSAGIPQALHIWRSRSARDIHFFSWFLWWTSLTILALYAWVSVPDPIVRISYTIGSIVNTAIIAGIVRARWHTQSASPQV